MTLPVVFRRAARHEFQDAARWYEARQTGLGLQYVAEVDRAVQMATEHPTRFPKMHREVRCVRVKRFPYSVFFLPEASRIVVLAVFHARRDPLVWQARV